MKDSRKVPRNFRRRFDVDERCLTLFRVNWSSVRKKRKIEFVPGRGKGEGFIKHGFGVHLTPIHVHFGIVGVLAHSLNCASSRHLSLITVYLPETQNSKGQMTSVKLIN